MRPSNAVRTVWDAEAIDTSHLGFRPIQKIATIHASSEFIRGIPNESSLDTRRNFKSTTLVSRFRSSQVPAAHSRANFGIKGTLANL